MLLNLLLSMKEFRKKKGIRYKFAYVIYFSILAILSDADSYRKIHTFLEIRFEKLKKQHQLSWKRMPSYSTIRNIIINLPSSALEKIFRQHANSLSDISEEKTAHYAFDGKVIKGSFDHFKEQKAIQLLSVFCSNNNLIMAHEEIECKTNEIPVAQKLIPKLGIENAIFTADAMSCQTNTINTVKATNNDIIVQVKGNQKKLLKECKKIAKNDNPISQNQEPVSKMRNRIESRVAKIFTADKLQHKKWNNVNCIIEIERPTKVYNTRKKKWVNTEEKSYYISTKIVSGKDANYYIRNHWGIENINHHVKDATMNEDKSRIRVKPQNMARFRSFALNIMRFNSVKNIKRELYINALSFANLLNYNGL